MSAYAELKTVMKDPRLLVAALGELGIKCEYHEEKAALVGYYGTSREGKKAEVIIRKKDCQGAYSDIGFEVGKDGNLNVLMDHMEMHQRAPWLGQIAQAYTEQRTMEVARQKGYLFRGRELVKTEKGTTTRLLFTVR